MNRTAPAGDATESGIRSENNPVDAAIAIAIPSATASFVSPRGVVGFSGSELLRVARIDNRRASTGAIAIAAKAMLRVAENAARLISAATPTSARSSAKGTSQNRIAVPAIRTAAYQQYNPIGLDAESLINREISGHQSP